jgi:histidinol-phosphate aminotransferase
LVKAEELVLPSVAALAPYEPGKPVEEVERELGIKNAVKLASNENPVGPSPLAVKALSEALSGLNRYPDGGGYYLRQRLATHHAIGVDEIFLGDGSCEILNLLAQLFLRPGLNAVVSEHSFVIYRLAVAATGAGIKTVPLNGLTLDLEAIGGAIDEHTRIVFLGNPNNPTGTIYRRAAWEKFLRRVPAATVIAADEAYFEFVRDADYPDSMRYHDGERILVTLRTFSKIFGLAGLRAGYAVARKDVVAMLNHVRQPFNVSSLAQAAVLAAMDDREHVRKTLEVNAAGVAYLEREFRRLGVGFAPTQANFVLAEVGDGRTVFDQLLRSGVIVRPMDSYGLPRHVRISVGLEEENRRLIEALEAALKRR